MNKPPVSAFLTLTLCAMAIAGAQPAHALVYDDFNDNVLNSQLWTSNSEGGVSAVEANQRLEITFSDEARGGQFGAGYRSTRQIRGDFDVQVSYALLNWPAKNGVRTGLNIITPGDGWRSVQRTCSGAAEPVTDYDIYGADYGDKGGSWTITSDTNGKLRMTRVGSVIKSYYYGATDWNLLYSADVSSADVGFAITAWSHDWAFNDQPVKMAFDDVIVAQGEIVPPVPEPASMLALSGGLLASSISAIRRKRRA